MSRVSEEYDVFLSYSRNDREAASGLRCQLERAGLTVFFDIETIRAGALWLDQLQTTLDRCNAFVVLVGRDGVRRWMNGEAQVALNRHFGPRDHTQRLPIFPILLGDTDPAGLPPFLRLFQAPQWDGTASLPGDLLGHIRERTSISSTAHFEGGPFVGLDAYRPDQAHLFFGRRQETLDALACFDTRPGAATVRWLEINGNSGSGKSSLMNAGLLPLVDQGWLWPRTGYERWLRIGPIMPGEKPVEMLAQRLGNAFNLEMADVLQRLRADEHGLRMWLRSRLDNNEQTAFLLAIDQFEELFTFADPVERKRFDHLLSAALDDPYCPLFVVSTVRSDFLDRFDELLPRLVPIRNRVGRLWTLPLIQADGLREIISGPARLAGLDVSEVQEAMVAEARDEPGALPLVENALQWLWEQRQDGRLSGRLFTDRGGLAGILSEGADALLARLGRQRGRALELLFLLVNIDPEGRRHTRRRMKLPEAVAVAGGGGDGRALIDRLAGTRARDAPNARRSLRLITISEDAEEAAAGQPAGGWVNLIHETLIRSKGLDADGKPQPFWPTFWRYIEDHKDRAARRERLQLLAKDWSGRKGLARLFGLAGWSALFGYRGLALPGTVEQRYLRWSKAVAAAQVVLLGLVLGPIVEGLYWAGSRGFPIEVAVDRAAYFLFREMPINDPIEIPPHGDRSSFEVSTRQHPFAAPFQIGSTEVTFDEWDACVADSACRYRPADQGWGRGTRPVINVSWEDAKAYVAWLSGKRGQKCRLPTEAEWEYACRAGTTTEYALPAPEGSDDIAGIGLANCANCGSEWDGEQTAPVASFPANTWGLHDMHGNAFEWVQDCYGGEDGDSCGNRVVRGGSWGVNQGNARCASRGRVNPNDRDRNFGFRVVCSSPITNH